MKKKEIIFKLGIGFLCLSALCVILFLLAPHIFAILLGQDVDKVCYDYCAEARAQCNELGGSSCIIGCLENLCLLSKNFLATISIVTFVLAIISLLYSYSQKN